MPVYRVTVSVRMVVSVQANNDADAGTIAHAYVDACVESGQAALPVPAAVRNVARDSFVQAATTDEGG